MARKTWLGVGWAGPTAFLPVAAAILCLAPAVQPARAVSVVLQDSNSLVTIDVDGPGGGAAGGVREWLMDGVNQNKLEWFWYRLGEGGPEVPINALGRSWMKVSDTNEDPGLDTLSVRYGSTAGLHVEAQFNLMGGEPGSGTSDLSEVIKIHNATGQYVTVHFFEYADFDLGGNPQDLEVRITGGNTAWQRDKVSITDYLMAETPAISPDLVEVSATGSILAGLTDGGPTTLSNFAGPLYNGDLAWAFEWDMVLAPGAEFITSKNKNISTTIVPEPLTLAGMFLGGLGLAGYLRKRRTSAARRCIHGPSAGGVAW